MIVTDMLNTQDLVLTEKVVPGAEDFGKRTGSIRSENYQPGSAGFKINYNGDVEFNEGTFRGTLRAGSAVFDSEIFSGPLYLSKDVPQPVTRTFNRGATASDITQVIGRSYRDVNGQYNNVNIRALRVASQTSNPTGENVLFWTITNVKVYAVYVNGSEVLLAEQTNESKTWYEWDVWIDGNGNWHQEAIPHNSIGTTHRLTLQNYLWFVFIASGFTMKLFNLPDSQPAETGTVWRDGNLLRIV